MKLFSMIRLVLWSFFGVRNSKAHASDLANVNFTLLPFVAIVL
ncbi:glycerol kinase, partial [Burkholderia multivorans]